MVAEIEEKIFRYPVKLRIISAFGTTFFFTITVLALRAKPENGGGFAWPMVMFLAFGVLNALLLWTVFSSIKTDSHGIVQVKLGRKQWMNWMDVQRVEHRSMSNSLVLHSKSGHMRIYRQLRGFIDLFQIVEGSVATGALPPPLIMPFRVFASWTLRVVLGGLTCCILAGGTYAAITGQYSSAAMLVGLGVANIVVFARSIYLRFEFDESSIRVIYLLRTVHYSVADLDHITLMQRDLDIAVILFFGSKTLEISDNQVLAAPERVYESLVRHYRLTEPEASDCS
jgi:hypothetical protein